MSIYRLERRGDAEELLRVLRNGGDPNVRKRAATALGDLDSPVSEDETSIVDGLIDAVRNDESEEVRAAAVDAIDRRGRNAVDQLLIDRADVDRGNKGARTTETLVAGLESDLAELRMVAANAASRSEDPRTVPPLIGRLDDEDPRVRARVARSCGQIGDPRAVEPLCSLLEDPFPRVRREAAEALGDIPAEPAIDPLLGRLEDESRAVRRSAVLALGNFEEPALVERLAAIIEDEVDLVRQAAIDSIIDLLANAPVDQSHEMRKTVVDSLSTTAADAVIGPLLEILAESTQVPHRRNAAWLLGRVGGDDPPSPVRGELCSALADEDPMVSQFATTSLVEIGGQSVETALLTFLDRDGLESRAKAKAVFALGEVGGERAYDRIDSLADETDSDGVRERAFSALSKLGRRPSDRREKSDDPTTDPQSKENE